MLTVGCISIVVGCRYVVKVRLGYAWLCYYCTACKILIDILKYVLGRDLEERDRGAVLVP